MLYGTHRFLRVYRKIFTDILTYEQSVRAGCSLTIGVLEMGCRSKLVAFWTFKAFKNAQPENENAEINLLLSCFSFETT